MTLTTLACAPPSCSARLPQKLSAARTWTTDAPPLVRLGEVAQPATASVTNAAAPAAHLDPLHLTGPTLTKTAPVIKCRSTLRGSRTSYGVDIPRTGPPRPDMSPPRRSTLLPV